LLVGFGLLVCVLASYFEYVVAVVAVVFFNAENMIL